MKLINLYSGPSGGKSSVAAGLYYQLKIANEAVELVREYVKSWAWEAREVKHFDQIYIFGKQVRKETLLLDKVDIIITDSPTLLSSVYEKLRYNTTCTLKSWREYRKLLENTYKVKIYDIMLNRAEGYQGVGRYETREQAIALDKLIEQQLVDEQIPYLTLKGQSIEEEVEEILKIINQKEIHEIL